MIKQDLLEYYLQIENAVCSSCEEEQGWAELVDRQLMAKYPKEHKLIRKGLPANHPLWKTWNECWAVHKTKCLVFEYDNLTVNICKKHFKEISELFLND